MPGSLCAKHCVNLNIGVSDLGVDLDAVQQADVVELVQLGTNYTLHARALRCVDLNCVGAVVGKQGLSRESIIIV